MSCLAFGGTFGATNTKTANLGNQIVRCLTVILVPKELALVHFKCVCSLDIETLSLVEQVAQVLGAYC